MATGSQIRKYRMKAGLTLEQLSELSGVEVGTISAIEQRNSTRSSKFGPLAAALGMTVEMLGDQDADHDVVKLMRIRTAGKSEPYQSSPDGPSKASLKAEEQPTVAGTLRNLGDLLNQADQKTRLAVATLLGTYAQDPATGQNIAQAIEVLLKTDQNNQTPG